ncbi:MAG: cupin domain-containing protein [Acidobacteriota bacterium]|nr:cupin domain-containing protein [Acidobacteriota bacterium]
MNVVRKFLDGFRWKGVEVLDYKPAGTHFRSISRQVLFDGPGELDAQLRYFAIEPGGHSTLERHTHTHAVMILNGRGRGLVENRVYDLAPFDLVSVPPGCWHQFRAAPDAPLGFLCLVSTCRDRPQRPTPSQLAQLRENPELAAFIRT